MNSHNKCPGWSARRFTVGFAAGIAVLFLSAGVAQAQGRMCARGGGMPGGGGGMMMMRGGGMSGSPRRRSRTFYRKVACVPPCRVQLVN